MASNFSEEQLADFKHSFDAFDKDNDGSISKAELRSLLRIVGEKFHAPDIINSMKEFDTNNDQKIDFDEFLVLAHKLAKNKTP
ncbi:unnamed protein product [Mortierella alpina]